jgi:hypothetical protein
MRCVGWKRWRSTCSGDLAVLSQQPRPVPRLVLVVLVVVVVLLLLALLLLVLLVLLVLLLVLLVPLVLLLVLLVLLLVLLPVALLGQQQQLLPLALWTRPCGAGLGCATLRPCRQRA